MQINCMCCPGSQIISQTTTISNLSCMERSSGTKGLERKVVQHEDMRMEAGVGSANVSAGAWAPVSLNI